VLPTHPTIPIIEWSFLPAAAGTISVASKRSAGTSTDAGTVDCSLHCLLVLAENAVYLSKHALDCSLGKVVSFRGDLIPDNEFVDAVTKVPNHQTQFRLNSTTLQNGIINPLLPIDAV